ncbi:hypothetical protein [Streptomyces sp. NPDC006527]|uniref:hypothetical protein n=1 Tax=Streptomyces sp. NPDC006527 TaxID=3364749 RepID=UPI0036CF0561
MRTTETVRPRRRVTGTAGGAGAVTAGPFTDLTGTVLRIGPVGSGTTEVVRTSAATRGGQS